MSKIERLSKLDGDIFVGRNSKMTMADKIGEWLQMVPGLQRTYRLWMSAAAALRYALVGMAVVLLVVIGGIQFTGNHNLFGILTSLLQSQSPAVPASQSPYGVTTVNGDAQLIKDLNDTSIQWVRYQIAGSSINWTQLDSQIAYFNKNGIHIDFSIHCVTASNGCFTNPTIPPVADYVNLAAKLAARYNGSGPNGDFIDAYEIGNEEFDATSPSVYPAYLKAGCTAIKQYSPHALCGMYGTYQPSLAHYNAVISSIFSAGVGQYMDFMNFHYYVKGQNPANPGSGMPSYNQVWQSYHSVASQYGYSSMPVWVTETGWPTANVGCCAAVSPQAQSQYLSYVMDQSRQSKVVQRVFWFTMDYGDQGDSLDRTSTGRLPAFMTLQNYVKSYPSWTSSPSNGGGSSGGTVSIRKPANIEYDGDSQYGSYQAGNLSNPNIAAVDVNMNWVNGEPSQGSFNWGPADKEMSDWVSHGKKFTIVIRYIYELSQSCSTGIQALPAWEVARIPHICSAKGDLIPDYFDPTFKSDLTAYVNAVAQHIAASPYKNNLEYVRIGLGQAGEPYPCLGCSSGDLQTLASWGYSEHNWALWQEAMLTNYQQAFSFSNVIYPLGENTVDPVAGVPVAQEVGYWAAAKGMGVGQQGLANTPGYANGEAVLIAKYVRSHYPNDYIQFQTNTAVSSASDIAGDITIAKSAGAWSTEWYANDSINPSYQSLFASWQQSVDAATCGLNCNISPPPPATPTVSLTASPSSVAAGGMSTLTWSSTNASSCMASGAWSGSEPLAGSSSTSALNVAMTYVLSCTGSGGSATASTTVSVMAPSPSPSPAPPPDSTISDTFDRSNRSGWGNATSGQVWQLNGKTFAISNNKGFISGNGASTATIGMPISTANVFFSGSLSGLSGTRLGSVLHYIDDNNWYMAYLDGSQFAVLKRHNGIYTSLSASNYTAKANVLYSVRFQDVSGTLDAKIWPANNSEPSSWLIHANDSAVGSGYAGIRTGLANGASASISEFSEK